MKHANTDIAIDSNAVFIAELLGCTLRKGANSAEGERDNLTPDEAREIVLRKSALVYLEVTEEHARQLGELDGQTHIYMLAERGIDDVRAARARLERGAQDDFMVYGLSSEKLYETYRNAYVAAASKLADEITTE